MIKAINAIVSKTSFLTELCVERDRKGLIYNMEKSGELSF
jgi:hypothetical protein